MKTFLLAVVLIGSVACSRADKDAAPDTAHFAAPPATDSIVAKIEPDTLVNEKGQKCVVRPKAKFDGVEIGESYANCDWR